MIKRMFSDVVLPLTSKELDSISDIIKASKMLLLQNTIKVQDLIVSSLDAEPILAEEKVPMEKYLQAKRVETLEAKVKQLKLVIKELLGGLECTDPEVRALIRDTAMEYLKEDE